MTDQNKDMPPLPDSGGTGFYTAAQMRERDAMWAERVRAALARHCAAPVAEAQPVGEVVPCEDYGRTIRWTSGCPIIGTKLYLTAPTPPAPQEVERARECGACHGSGWVVRDADIGTDQECFSCGGSDVDEETTADSPTAADAGDLCPCGFDSAACKHYNQQGDCTLTAMPAQPDDRAVGLASLLNATCLYAQVYAAARVIHGWTHQAALDAAAAAEKEHGTEPCRFVDALRSVLEEVLRVDGEAAQPGDSGKAGA